MNSLDHPDYYRPFYELIMRDEYRKNPSFFLDFSFKEFPAKKYNLFPLKKEVYIEDFTLVKLDVLADAGKIKDYNFELSRVISCRKIVYTKYEVDNYEYSLTDSGRNNEIK